MHCLCGVWYTQCRSEREKSILHARVKSLQRHLAEGNERPLPSQGGGQEGGHSVGELEKVITSMRKVIEKLQAENESLKKSSAISRPAQGRTEGGKKVTALQEENSKLKVNFNFKGSLSIFGQFDNYEGSTFMKHD